MKAANWPDFTPTKWATAGDKATAATAILRLVEGDFKRTLFTRTVYNALHQHLFSHMAHYDAAGFFHEWFGTLDRQLDWLRYVDGGGAFGVAGDPNHCWSDVERALMHEFRRRGYIARWETLVAADTEQRELATLAALQAKYAAHVPADGGLFPLIIGSSR